MCSSDLGARNKVCSLWGNPLKISLSSLVFSLAKSRKISSFYSLIRVWLDAVNSRGRTNAKHKSTNTQKFDHSIVSSTLKSEFKRRDPAGSSWQNPCLIAGTPLFGVSLHSSSIKRGIITENYSNGV